MMAKMTAVLAVLLCLAAVYAQEPEIDVEDGNILMRVQEGKAVTFKFGENTSVNIPGSLDDIKQSVSGVRDSVSATNSNLQTLSTTVDANARRIDAQARDIRANADSIVQQSASLSRVQRDVDLSQTVYDSIMRAFDAVNNSTADQLRVCRGTVTNLTAQVSDLSSKLSSAQASLKTAQDALAAAQKQNADLQTNIQANNFISAQLTPDCSVDGCTAAGENTVRIFARGTFFADVQGIYTCVFTTAEFNNHVYRTPATAKYFISANPNSGMYEINCKTPKYFDKDVPAPNWSTTLQVLEAGKVIPFITGADSTKVKFFTTGPTITPIADQVVEGDALKDTVKYPDGTYPVSVELSDADSAPTSIKMTVQSSNQTLLADNTIVVSGTGALRVIRFKPNFPTDSVRFFTMNVTVMDEHNRTRSYTFKVTVSPYYNRLLFNLNTQADAIRSYHDTNFWASNSWTFNDGITDPLNKGDIKHSNYFRVPLGPTVKMVAHMNGVIYATAFYNVRAAFQTKTILDLVTGSYNTVFADKDINLSTQNTVTKPIASRFFVDANGNSGQERGDPFFDFNDNLMAHVNGWACAQTNLMRLGTDRRVGSNYGPLTGNCGGHVYTGIGGAHQNNGWCIAFEAQPIIGYCDTYNRYGDATTPPFGGCTYHPYNSPCNGDKRNTPLSIAFYAWGA